MENTKKSEGNSRFSNLLKVIKGSIISILISLILLLITAAILTYTNVSESVIPGAVIAISALSILIGSILSSMNIKKNGLLNGLLVGLIYMVVIYLISSIAITGFSMNMKTIIMLIASGLAGIVGGIIGVNIHK